MPRKQRDEDGRHLQVFLSGVNSRSFTLYIPSAVDTLAELCQFIAEEVPVFVPNKGGRGGYSMAGDEDNSKSVYRFLYSVSGKPLWCVAECLELGRIVVSVNPGFTPPDPSLLMVPRRDVEERKVSTPVGRQQRQFASQSAVPSFLPHSDSEPRNLYCFSPDQEPPLVSTTARRSSPSPIFASQVHQRSLSPFPIPPSPPSQSTTCSATRKSSKRLQSVKPSSLRKLSPPVSMTSVKTSPGAIVSDSSRNVQVADRPIKDEESSGKETDEAKDIPVTANRIGSFRAASVGLLKSNNRAYDWNLTSCELLLIRKWKPFQHVRHHHINSEVKAMSSVASSSLCLLGVMEVRHLVRNFMKERTRAGTRRVVASAEHPGKLRLLSGCNASSLPPFRIVVSGPRGSGSSTLGAMILYELLHASIPLPSDAVLQMNAHDTKASKRVNPTINWEESCRTPLKGYLMVLLDLSFLVEQALEELSVGGVSASFSATKTIIEGYDRIDDIAANLLFWCEAVLYAVVDSAVACRRFYADGKVASGEINSRGSLSGAIIAEFWMSMLYPMSSYRNASQLREEVVECVGEEVVSYWEEFAQFAGILFREAFSSCTAANLSGMSSNRSSNLINSSSAKNSSNDEGTSLSMAEVLSLRDDALQLIFRDLGVEIARSLGYSGIFFVIDGLEILRRGTSPSPSRPLGDLSAVLQGLCDPQQTPYIHVLLITSGQRSMKDGPLSVSYIPGVSISVEMIGFLGPDSPTAIEHLPKHIHCFDEVFPLDIFLGAPGYLTFLQQLCLREPESGKVHVPSCVQLNFSTVHKALRQLQRTHLAVPP